MSVDTLKQAQKRNIKKILTDPKRLAAVKTTQLLDTPPEEAFDRLTRLASKLLKTPISFVTLLEQDRDFVKSQVGLPEPLASQREIRAHPSFCQHIISHTKPLILEDARTNPLFSDFPSVTGMGVVAYAGIPLITADGNALGTCCVLDFKPRKWTKDEIGILTELAASVMTEINLRTVATQLQREIQYKDDFIGIASHELKTPLTSLIAFNQMLKKKTAAKGDDDMLEELNKIDRQLNKLNILVGDLLDVTKIEGGKLKLRKADFNMTELVKEIIEDLQRTISTHKIIFKTRKNITLLADQERIGQVITNLISNAVKYSPGKETVIVDVKESKNSVVLRIEDFGMGIPSEKITRVFERFYRVGGDRTKTLPGLGLGLYISNEIAKRHDGKITIESTEGKGSVFHFSIPYNKKGQTK